MGYYADLIKAKQNAKEEKDNEDPQIATLRRKALQKIKEAQKKADWYGDTVMQKFEKDLTYAEEEDVPELAGALDRYLPKFEAKVKSFGNSDEEEGYYAKLAEEKKEKKNAGPWRVEFLGNSHYIETIKDCTNAQSRAQRDLAMKERELAQWGEEVREEYWKFSQQIRKIEKELEKGKNNSKEEGHYAKLAEEKKEKENAKMVSFAGKTFRIEDDGTMDQGEYDRLRERYFEEQDRIKEERSKLQAEMDKLAREFNEVKNKIKNLGRIH